jgi:dipeptidyl aminopeptidase/acylaminoacyl peptidase
MRVLAPQLSPDGGRLMYTRVGRDSGSTAVDAYLWISSVSGGPPIRLTAAVGLELPGSWSPDGDWYVYAEVAPDGRGRLRKARTSGHLEPVTLAGWAPENVPVWSSRGDWILFDDGELKLIAADGSETRNLGVKDAVCAFALAEDLLHCIQNVDNARSLLAIDFGGGTRWIAAVRPEHVPVATGQPGIRFSLTPDGHAVTYAVASTQIKLMLADGLANVDLP